jgi:signal transduction histidine kinase
VTVTARDGVRRTGRDWAVDAAAFLLAVGFAVGLSLLPGDRGLAPPWVVVADQVGGVLACAALWWRRRWPFQLALALAGVSAFSATAGAASAVALLTVAVRRTLAQAVVSAALGVATAVIFAVLRPDPDLSAPFVVVLSTVITLAILGWGLVLRQRRQLLASLRERAERAEQQARLRSEHAQARARAQIAREMHDVLGHRLSLLAVQAGALEFRRDAVSAEVAGAATVIRASAHQALEDLREVIGVLRAEVSELPQPTLAELAALVGESRRTGMRVSLSERVEPDAVPERLGRAAYRIVQEGLTNARKHAPGQEVTLTLSGAAGSGLTVELRNPLTAGAGPAPLTGAGRGLIGLTERAILAGGYLASERSEPDPATGRPGEWRLWVWLPWPL